MEDSCFNVASFMAKTLNKPNEELAALLYSKTDEGETTLKEDAEDIALGLIQEKIQGIKEEGKAKQKEAQDNFHKKGLKEASEKLESELREKYGLESDSQGIELVDELVERFKADDSKLTPDKIKLTDTYREREKQLKKEAAELLKAKGSEIEQLKTSFEKDKKWQTVQRDIRGILMEKKPVLPKNQRVAENLVNLFMDSFSEYDWQLDDNGNHVPVKNGERVEDNLGNALQFNKLVEARILDFFDLQVQDKKGSAGNEPTDEGAGDVPTKFASEEEYNNYIDNTTDPDKRIQAYDNWKAQQ